MSAKDESSRIGIPERVIGALRRIAAEDAAGSHGDQDRAWTVASQVSQGDYVRAQAGIDLALRRAERIVEGRERGDDHAPADSYEEFIAQSVRDAARIEAVKLEVLRHLGWTPAGTSAGMTKSAYQEAIAIAARIVKKLAGNASADEVLHHAMINLVNHFAHATEPDDIPNPKGYAFRAIRNAAVDALRSRHADRPDSFVDQQPESRPGPEMTAIAEPFFPHLRFDISCRLFGGVLAPVTAALLLGLVSATGEGARLESWSWPDPPMPNRTGAPADRLKYWVLRKILPDRFTPRRGVWSDAQRQDARQQMSRARSHLGQMLRENDVSTVE